MTKNRFLLEWLRFEISCILGLLMSDYFLFFYALYLNLLKLWLVLMDLILDMLLNFKQVIFITFFTRVFNQILIKFLGFNSRLAFGELINLRNFRWFIIDLDKTLCKLKYFIIGFHVKISKQHLSFVYDAVFLIFYFFN